MREVGVNRCTTAVELLKLTANCDFFPTVSEFLAANSSDKRQGKAEAKFVKV